MVTLPMTPHAYMCVCIYIYICIYVSVLGRVWRLGLRAENCRA